VNLLEDIKGKKAYQLLIFSALLLFLIIRVWLGSGKATIIYKEGLTIRLDVKCVHYKGT
jgi:hypothetical protein